MGINVGTNALNGRRIQTLEYGENAFFYGMEGWKVANIETNLGDWVLDCND